MFLSKAKNYSQLEAVLLDWQLPEQLAKQKSCMLRLDLRQKSCWQRSVFL